MNQLRETILSEQQKIASKSRFGLFSQPPPIAIGDDSPYKHKLHPRAQDGKPITKQRNLLPGPNRSGQGKKGYFAVPDSIYQGDIYQDTFKVQIQYERKMHSKSTFHQNQFKPGSGYKTLIKSSYQYVQQKENPQKKRFLDQNGRVKTKPRNIYTNQTTKVERQFMKHPEYIPDPIERKLQRQRKQREIFNSKLPQTAWKFAKNTNPTFAKSKTVFGQDDQAKKLLSQRKQPKKIVLKTVAHEAPFVPSKRPCTGTIGKYPKAMSAQSLQTLRPRALTTNKKQQDVWKPSSDSKSRPTPSISLLKKNLFRGRYK